MRQKKVQLTNKTMFRHSFPESLYTKVPFLDISLPFFTGLCRYGSNEVDSIGTFSNINANACRQKCKGTSGCTAIAVDSFQSCVLYKGGPYTKGDGYSGITCYIMHIGKCLSISIIVGFMYNDTYNFTVNINHFKFIIII